MGGSRALGTCEGERPWSTCCVLTRGVINGRTAVTPAFDRPAFGTHLNE
jgi:hypothetical protein